MKTLSAIAGLMLLAGPALAQGGGRMMMGPPDHWMTFDSLVAAVGITDAQKAEAQKHYDALNGIMKQAAEARRSRMEAMRSGGGMQMSQEQRDALRAEGEKRQKDVDTHYGELRALLTPEQQAKLDALPKPMVMPMRRGPGM